MPPAALAAWHYLEILIGPIVFKICQKVQLKFALHERLRRAGDNIVDERSSLNHL
jgi:hypothetical protein